MLLKNALKLKNQLVSEISDLGRLIQQNNSIIEGNKREYSIAGLLTEYDAKVLELSKLKADIQKANVPVHEKIFLLSELKSKAGMLKGVNSEQGKVKRSGYMATDTDTYEVELSQRETRDMIKDIEIQIRKIQDELDEFNGTTEI